MPESALLIEVPETERFVAHWRRRYDAVANHGIPAHVTILYPFRAPDAVREAEVETVEEIAAQVRAFEFSLTRVDQFPGVVWLHPEPEESIRSLMGLVQRAFPDCPPYGGTIADPQPHLTVADVDDAAEQAKIAHRFTAEVEPSLPIRCRAESLALFVSDDEGEWRPARRFDLLGLAPPESEPRLSLCSQVV